MMFARWIVAIGAALLVVSLVLVVNRTQLSQTPHGSSFDSEGRITHVQMWSPNEQGEITVWCLAGLAGVLGVGMVLIGLAKWPTK